MLPVGRKIFQLLQVREQLLRILMERAVMFFQQGLELQRG